MSRFVHLSLMNNKTISSSTRVLLTWRQTLTASLWGSGEGCFGNTPPCLSVFLVISLTRSWWVMLCYAMVGYAVCPKVGGYLNSC